MKKGKIKSREGKIFRAFVVLFASLVIMSPLALSADPATTEGEGGGFFSGISRGVSNFFSGLPSIFSELSPADVGHKPRIKPHFSATQGFSSNARLGPKQADAAWQARIAPGITFSIPSGKLYTEFDYTYGFSTTQGRHTSANISTHNLSALARYDLSADTVFGLGNNIQLSEVPGEPGEPFILETATAQVKHRLGPKLSASLSDTVQVFSDKSKVRRNTFVDNGVNVQLPYDVTNDLSLGPTFAWNVRNFQKLNDKDYWQIQPGISAGYRLGPKTNLHGNFGWAYRKFSNGSNDSESELVYGAGLSHKLGRKFIWSLDYAKTLVDTFDTGFVFRDTPEATTLDNLNRDFRVVKSHRLSTSATYRLNEKNSFNAFADFQFIDANPKDDIVSRRDGDEKAMEIGGGYTYRLNRYVTFDVTYAFGRRFTADASVPAARIRNEYTYHKLSGGVNIAI